MVDWTDACNSNPFSVFTEYDAICQRACMTSGGSEQNDERHAGKLLEDHRAPDRQSQGLAGEG
jgi:hypothetical protein